MTIRQSHKRSVSPPYVESELFLSPPREPAAAKGDRPSPCPSCLSANSIFVFLQTDRPTGGRHQGCGWPWIDVIDDQRVSARRLGSKGGNNRLSTERHIWPRRVCVSSHAPSSSPPASSTTAHPGVPVFMWRPHLRRGLSPGSHSISL